MDPALRDRRIVVACLVWGAALEKDADEVARSITPGLKGRDVLLLAALAFDRQGRALPSQLVGPVHTTSAGVTGSLHRLESAGLVRREIGEDRRTHPVVLTQGGWDLIAEIVEPWQAWFDSRLSRLTDDDRTSLYRLLVKGSGLWDGVWPAEFDLGGSR